MIKVCPKCETERPLSEMICSSSVEGMVCGWDLMDVAITDPQAATPSSSPLACPNGHAVSAGDLLCVECGEELIETAPVAEEQAATDTPAKIGDWLLREAIEGLSHVQQRYVAERDQTAAILTLYQEGYEPDTQVFEVLQRLDVDHVPQILEIGRFEGRAFVVTELLGGGSLADFTLEATDLATIRRVVDEVGRALDGFAQMGLRHRDLRPGSIRIRSADPLDLVITGFGSARLSELDLDIVSPLETSRYMAPEAVMGGVSAASDWWSLGVILLELLTRGACFEGVGDQLFLIHVLSNGIQIPQGLEPSVSLLLRGLLAKERTQRWGFQEVNAWLSGEDLPAPTAELSAEGSSSGPSLQLGGNAYFQPQKLALAASRAQNWDEALSLLASGRLATWAEEAGIQGQRLSALRVMGTKTDFPGDFRLGVALKLLNPNLPLIQREEIVSPGWLIENPEIGYQLVTGPFPKAIKKLGFDTEDWLLLLSKRAETVRQRAKALDVEIQAETFRLLVLTTSRARLVAEWDERRKWFPDTEHPGIASLLDRPNLADEDLLLLCVASPHQFRAREQILTQARELAASVNLQPEALQVDALSRPRREVFADVDRRIEGFARCGVEKLDQWADQFRLTRRLELEKAAVLLSVPTDHWHKPEHQDYVSRILQFFEKKVAGAVLRGPLVRMSLGKTTPRVDLTELSDRPPALLDKLLLRSEQILSLNPEVFAGANNPESRLRNLVTRTVAYQRDTGINGLYLGFPFLLRRDRPGTNVRPRLAPILLWPVKVKAEVGNRGHISIAFDRERDEVRLNPAFEGMMGIEGASRWREVARELLENQSLRAADVLDALGVLASLRHRELISLPGKEADVEFLKDQIASAAVLFHVEFMGQAVVEDLRQLQTVPPAGSALETMLRIGDKPPEVNTAPASQDFLITHSDPSQESAIGQAWRPPGLLVQGPPGTGKSQTIVNLVGDAIGRRKSLLIVCQKLPALEVVKKRLVAEGLGDRLVMITDVNRDREPVLRSLREQLDKFFTESTGTVDAKVVQRESLSRKMAELEGEIDRHHQAIYKLDERTTKSYRDILSDLLALENTSRVALDFPGLRRMFVDLPPTDIDQLEETCGSLAVDWLPAKFEASPLHALKQFSTDPAMIAEFNQAFSSYLHTDQKRGQLISTTAAGPELEEPETTSQWLQQFEDRFMKLTQSTRDRLKAWLDLFLQKGQGHAYLQVMNKLVQLQTEQKRVWLDLPTLRDLEKIECGNLAELWLRARFEESPLHTLRAFEPEAGTVGAFQAALYHFVEAEKQRNEVVATSLKGLETEKGNAVDEWLEENEAFFQGWPDAKTENLASWLPHFRGKQPGLGLIEVLENHLRLLTQMDPAHHQDELFPFLSGLTPVELLEWVGKGAKASAPAKTLFSKLSPARMLARKRVARQLRKLGEPATRERLLDFYQAAALEQELRKTRKALKSPFEELGRGLEGSPTLAVLKSEVQALLTEVRHAREAAERLSRCPFVVEAEQAATARNLPQLLPMMRGASLRNHARNRSKSALTGLQSFVESSWLNKQEQSIVQATSTNSEHQRLIDSLHTLIPFQEFRAAVSPAAVPLFKELSALRAELSQIPGSELEQEVNRLIQREHLLKERLKLEALQPILKLEASDREIARALEEIAELTSAIESNPRSPELAAAAREAEAAGMCILFAQMHGAVERCRSRRAVLAAMESLDEWVKPEWAEERRMEVCGSQSTSLQPMQSALPTLAAFQLFRRRSETLTPQVLEVFAQLSQQRPALEQIPRPEFGAEVKRLIRREACLGWKMRLEAQEPLLHSNREELGFKVRSLDDCDKQLRERNREHLATFVERDRVMPRKQWDELLMLRGARARRLREVLVRGPEFGLLALRPVWLMNPEVASQLLPCTRGLFDLVIYDEASQMPVEYALPTLYRARNVVVSGDDKQMPPTSFFASKVESDEAETFDGEMPEEGITEEERDAIEETWNRREIKDCPDLLHLAMAALPQVTLQIHYRSLYRELISFSNAAFYHNDLSVPVRHPAEEVRRIKPIEFIQVDGIYEEQSNPQEATRVVDYLSKLWKLSPRPSVGVVTFNRKQADLILRCLEERAENDPEFRVAYSQESERQDNGEDMAVFVKNVENVQGDERDVIVFSTTFGKNRMGVFRRNFGVLGQKGGERRLNVAVTRARRKIVILTSIPIPDISDMLSTRKTVGVPRDYLQAYLEFARLLSRGELDEADLLRQRSTGDHRPRTASSAQRDGLAQSVETYLTELGYTPDFTGDDPALGIDFALVNPQTKQFAIGIECEAPRHRLLTLARAREIWRPTLLAAAYKRVHRVSAHGWYHDREQEKEKLRNAIAQALPSEVTLERA